MSSFLTLNGTKIVDGIEYNEYPAPKHASKSNGIPVGATAGQ